jgi:DNA-binding response OmpR family regulator
MHIALLEDDIDQQQLLGLWLSSGGHTHSAYATVASMLAALKCERFDLLIVDWMLPDGTGESVLDWVRQNLGWDVPVIVVTAREEEAIVVAALRAGADDYVVKPPKPMELLARLQAVARRAKPGGLPVLRMGAYEIDVAQHRLSVEHTPVTLTQKEFDLSVYLFQNPGKLLSRDHLLNKIWGFNADIDTRTVDTHVSRLRKKLFLDGAKGWKLVPVYGYGYRFDRSDELPAKDAS